MAGVTVKTTKLTHKDGKPRRKLAKTRVAINNKPYDLRKVAARRRLVPKR